MSISQINDVVFANVTADEPLSSLIDDSQKYQIENLKVSGKLNGDDILFLREMAGHGREEREKTSGVLKNLDLSDACISNGGSSYYVRGRGAYCGYDYYISQNDKISNYMFYECESLMSITLPTSITFIGEHAFVGCCKLKEIHFKSDVPPTLEEVSALDEIFPLNRYKELFTTIYIPKGSKAAYDNEEQPWNLFPQIIEE